MQVVVRWLAAYRHRSAVAAAAMAGMPLLMVFSAAMVAMPTLRGDLRDGLVVAGGAALFLAVVQLLVRGPVLVTVAGAMLIWLPAVAIAAVLLRTRSLSLCLQLLTVLACLAVVLFSAVVGDPAAWWRPVIEEIYGAQLAQIFPAMDQQQLVAAMARFMTGAMIAGWFLTVAVGMLAGRWFQSLLDRPGAFGEEFRGHRLGRVVGLGAALVFVLAGFLGSPLLQNLVLVLLAAFLLQGLALAHWLVQQRNLGRGWLVAVYVLLLLGMPWTPVLLASAGFLDNWLGARRRTSSENDGVED